MYSKPGCNTAAASGSRELTIDEDGAAWLHCGTFPQLGIELQNASAPFVRTV
jgi:hypothetical protein